ncbi:hypothetical protein [Vibrio crassostreae]|uniref:hypothetical protein n=1 Tax=Vibrio crassostreae TaxID=246167 RepID=UPI001B3172A3|nr:hypothetical protein [Vibrio crassostreae]
MSESTLEKQYLQNILDAVDSDSAPVTVLVHESHLVPIGNGMYVANLSCGAGMGGKDGGFSLSTSSNNKNLKEKHGAQ